MKSADEPPNWLGLVLILVVVAVVALAIRWVGAP